MAEKKTYTNRIVSNIFNDYASCFGKSCGKARSTKFPVPLLEMKNGDEFLCGMEIDYPNDILEKIRFICFECFVKFDSLDSKMKHVMTRHCNSKSMKICKTCLNATRTTNIHTNKVSGKMTSLFGKSGGGNSKEEVRDTVAQSDLEEGGGEDAGPELN